MSKLLVVDSGIAVKWFVNESDSAQANLIYEGYESGNLEFLAPDLIHAEFGNILWKKQVLQGFDRKDAEIALIKFRKV